MDKYINKLIRGFKKIFNKKYVAVVSVFVGIISVLGFTYGYFSSESGWQLAAQLRIRNLYYTMTIDGATKASITAPANSGTTYHDIVVTSLNDINTRYSLTYKSNVSGVTVDASSKSVNKQEGVIGLYTTGTTAEKTKTIRVAVTNNTATAASVTFNVAGGYTWNPESEVAIQTGYSRITTLNNEVAISGGLTLAEEVAAILNCTPTSTMPCLYKENANNYLTYGGYTWRIMGTYLVSGEKVVKLVLDDILKANCTWSNANSKVLVLYTTLSKTLVRTSSPFSCTGTTTLSCSGSSNYGSVNKAEYDLIGGVNSYLYTKPNENYWLNQSFYAGTSRGLSNLNSSATAYVRPSIYLKSTVVNAHSTGEYGTATNPYEIVEGVQVTFNGLTEVGATTYMSSGYFAPGQTYTLNNPTTTNTNYSFKQWVASGTGSSVSGTSFTMGTAATTLTATWTGTYNYTGTYKTYVATADGYYFIETKGAQGGDVTSSLWGGRGGVSSGYIYLNEGDTLYVYVGGQGSVTSTAANQTAAGGWNGGGSGVNYTSSGRIAAGGGGATDIRYFGSATPTSSDLAWNSDLGLNSRIMVAGGGGGSWDYPDGSTEYNGQGGPGGGLVGGWAQSIYNDTNGSIAAGGTQKGSTFGTGAGGTSQRPGGGGGYYGGNNVNYAAAGGSSFISGYIGCNAITSSTDRTPTNTLKHYSGKYFVGGSMKVGENAGNGSATITYYGNRTSVSRVNTKIASVRYIKNCISGSISNTGNHFVEIQAVNNAGENVAKGKTPTGATENGSYITDGDIDRTNYGHAGYGNNKCITIDLGATYVLDQIGVWHYSDERIYFDNTTSVSTNNSTWTKLLWDDGAAKYDGWIVSSFDDFYNNYTKANYITISGTSSFNTGQKPHRRVRVLVDMSLSSVTAQARTISSIGNLYFESYINANSQYGAVMQDSTGTGGWANSGVSADTVRHLYILNGISRTFGVYRNSSTPTTSIATIDLSSYSVKNTGNQNIYLFGRPSGNYAAGNVYSAKVYENFKLVGDYIPVTKISNSAVGLYDRVSGTFTAISGAVAH